MEPVDIFILTNVQDVTGQDTYMPTMHIITYEVNTFLLQLKDLEKQMKTGDKVTFYNGDAIEVGSTIRFDDRIGIVERILEDENCRLAIVRFIGNSEFNLRPINTDYIECVDNPYVAQVREASSIIHSTLNALRESVNEEVASSYIDEFHQVLHEYEEYFGGIFDDDYKFDPTTEE